jgi:hypothetical protein
MDLPQHLTVTFNSVLADSHAIAKIKKPPGKAAFEFICGQSIAMSTP